ncbi:hypothetical protein KEJ49_02375 [Candidatus Bathyarchaeota archaeon]|nr:hypothetical protein [Candidatus Bathyarchaeota archaeon]
MKILSRSLSRIPIRISFPDLNSSPEARGELVRIYAPLTVETILRRLPIDGRAHRIDGGISIIIEIRRGEEKPVRRVEEGSIAYWPMGGAINVYLTSTTTPNPVNRIGRVIEGLEVLEGIPSGSRVRVERANS